MTKSKRLIITADDFGMSLEVNEAVEEAHRKGLLTCASLVVAGDAAGDAIRRAKAMPNLGLGLHLAQYGAPVASAGLGQPLSDDGVNLGANPVRTGIAIMLSPKARAVAKAEIAAQFAAYAASRLPLTHLDGHWHCHQHPAVLAMALELGKPLGLKAVRIPYEPWRLAAQVSGRMIGAGAMFQAAAHRPLAAMMRWQCQSAGLATNDYFFGKGDAGAMDAALMIRMARALPNGLTELGLHPSNDGWAGRGPNAPPAHWQLSEEVRALCDPSLRAELTAQNITLCRWADVG
ncbi:MAG: hypothetical protein RLY97_1915 [Pseudomonadota bacterium]|jgi:hopanoid biosynthesis associated protein HpnK